MLATVLQALPDLHLVPLLGIVGVVSKAVFVLSAFTALIGALLVVFSRNPVHSALWLVVTLFAIAVLFVSLQAHFLAVVQIIVYAGAIVVLFLFVIMLLGVDKSEAVQADSFQSQAGIALGVVVLLELAMLSRLGFTSASPTGDAVRASITPVVAGKSNVQQLAETVFTRYLLAFEATSVLLVIAVVGAVVLARRVGDGPGNDADEPEEQLEAAA